MVGFLGLAGIAALRGASSAPSDVVVYVTGEWEPPSPVKYAAEATVTWMFDKIGVRLTWHDGQLTSRATSTEVAIQIQFALRAPADFSPGALAHTLPFRDEPTVITLLYDRICRVASLRPKLAEAILAHVLAHEITHVLERSNRHADKGLMKGHWDTHDYDAMEKRPLEFVTVDVDLINQGLSWLKCQASLRSLSTYAVARGKLASPGSNTERGRFETSTVCSPTASRENALISTVGRRQ